MGVPRDVPGIPGYLVLRDLLYYSLSYVMGVVKDVLGIPGYLVLRDSTVALCDGSSWGCPGNPEISIEGSAIITLFGDR